RQSARRGRGEPFALRAERLARKCREVVGGEDQEDRCADVSGGFEKTLAQLGILSPGDGGRGETHRGPQTTILRGGEERELSAEGVAHDGETALLDVGPRLQVGDTREDVVEVIGGQELELEVIARLFPLRLSLAGQHVAEERALARRQTVSSPEEIEEQIAVPGELRTHVERRRRGGGTRGVGDENCRKRARAGGLPQESGQAEFPA